MQAEVREMLKAMPSSSLNPYTLIVPWKTAAIKPGLVLSEIEPQNKMEILRFQGQLRSYILQLRSD
jgi:hypothetical protein